MEQSLSSPEVIVTLAENQYFDGAAALYNSLFAKNYKGDFWIGYRGDLPCWASNVSHINDELGVLEVQKDRKIYLLKVFGETHMAQLKASTVLKILDAYYIKSSLKKVYYFDPDIVIKANWSFFDEWTNYGVALCEDITTQMPMGHPFLKRWEKFANDAGFSFEEKSAVYVNSGFVGLSVECIDLLKVWDELLGRVSLLEKEEFGKSIYIRDRSFEFHIVDQDVLNVAFRATSFPVSMMGKDGMDFAYNSYLMAHATGCTKPWIPRRFLDSLHGVQPKHLYKSFLAHSSYPIRVYSKQEKLLRELDLALATFISHFIKQV